MRLLFPKDLPQCEQLNGLSDIICAQKEQDSSAGRVIWSRSNRSVYSYPVYEYEISDHLNSRPRETLGARKLSTDTRSINNISHSLFSSRYTHRSRKTSSLGIDIGSKMSSLDTKVESTQDVITRYQDKAPSPHRTSKKSKEKMILQSLRIFEKLSLERLWYNLARHQRQSLKTCAVALPA